MNDKKHFITIVLAVIIICTSLIMAIDEDGVQKLRNKPLYAQTSSSSSASSFSAVHITKDTTNSYALSLGFTSIGTFDTTYTILGNITSIENTRDLIISTITKDYDSTPTVGYVKVAPQNTSQGDASSSSQQSTIANPFADKATINQKITTEIQKAIESAAKSNFVNLEIRCDFGMDLSDWKCSNHSLLS
jgi:hypothetical protein